MSTNNGYSKPNDTSIRCYTRKVMVLIREKYQKTKQKPGIIVTPWGTNSRAEFW